jgi:hypothetical protein
MKALIICLLAYAADANTHANIMHIVADDLGYDDLGHNSLMGNGGKSLTPNINSLIDTGIAFHEYYTFKVCSPTRASLLTGRCEQRLYFPTAFNSFSTLIRQIHGVRGSTICQTTATIVLPSSSCYLRL